jgi:hypothetical protein
MAVMVTSLSLPLLYPIWNILSKVNTLIHDKRGLSDESRNRSSGTATGRPHGGATVSEGTCDGASGGCP